MNRIIYIVYLYVIILSLSCDPDRNMMPVTTTSEEARELFIQGRELYENYCEEYSDTYFQKAIELDPEFALAHLWFWSEEGVRKSKSLIKNVSEGESLMIRAQEVFMNENVGLSCSLVDSLIRVYPRDKHCLLFAGEIWSYCNEDKAISYFKRAIQIDKYYSAPYIRTCVLLKRLNRYEEAEEWYDRYIGLLPYSGIANVVYGNYLMEKGETSEALNYYKHALTFEPDYLTAYKYIIWANIVLEKYDEAINYCHALSNSKISDNGTSAYLFRSPKEIALSLNAMIYYVKGDFEESIRLLNRLIQFNKDENDFPEVLWGMHLRSWYEMESGFLDQAFNTLLDISDLAESESIDEKTKLSSSFWANGTKSMLFGKKGDLIQAEEYLLIARVFFNGILKSELETKLMASFDAALSIKKGDYVTAIEQVIVPAKSGPNPCRYYLAKAYDLAGQKEEAMKYYSLNCQIMNPFFSGLFYNESKQRFEELRRELN